MADLTNRNADLPIGIVGLTTAGVPETPVGSDTSGNLLVKDSNAITVLNTISTNTTAVNTSGSIAANGNILLFPNGGITSLGLFTGIVLEISGTWNATLTLTGSNGGSYYTIDVINLSNPNAGPQSTITANGLYYAPVGTVDVAFAATGYVSGTVICYASLRVNPLQFEPTTLQTVKVQDGSGNAINSQSNALDVNTKTPLVYSAPITASVGTTSTLILAANANRKGLYLSNTTATQQISLGFDGNAAGYQYGLTLFPGEKFWMDEYSFSTGAIYAITSGTTTYIGIQEIT